jgi:hypothetical protein
MRLGMLATSEGTPWMTILSSAGSALLGAVVGSGLTTWASRRQSRSDRQNERLRLSQDTARSVDTWIYELQAEIDEALDGQNELKLQKAAQTFSVKIGPALSSFCDLDLVHRITNNRTFAQILANGPSGTNWLAPRIPTPPLLAAFERHQVAVHEALQAHRRETPLPPYTEPPLSDLAALEQWAG